MPYATNQDVRIYYQVGGNGEALVLHHGTSGSGEDWRDVKYYDALKHDYQLILIDARGHGASDKPYDPAAYDLSSRVGDVTAVLDDLEIHQAHFFGYSMGGWIGFGLAKYAPERVHSLILGGAHPYTQSMQATRELMTKDPEGYLARAEKAYGAFITPGLRARLYANDLKALAALTQDRRSLSNILSTMHMPCVLFVGETDSLFPRVKQCVTEMPNASLFSLPECDHIATIVRSDLVLPHVKTFLAKNRK